MTPPVDHMAATRRSNLRTVNPWRGECLRCPWAGEWRETEDDADADAAAHVADPGRFGSGQCGASRRCRQPAVLNVDSDTRRTSVCERHAGMVLLRRLDDETASLRVSLA